MTMKLATIITVLMMTFPVMAFATSQLPAQTQVPPNLQVENDDTKPIPDKVLQENMESCKYHIPERFTPMAREYYCTCNAAALKSNFLMGEFKALQPRSSHVVTNKTFTKYMVNAVMPCIDSPVQQIEYMNCVENSQGDMRIGKVVEFCACVGRKARDHAIKYGLPEMMVSIGQDPKGYKEPLDALWNNSNFNEARNNARTSCLSNADQ